MKIRTLLIAVVPVWWALTATNFAQTRSIDGFMGMAWGQDIPSAKSVVLGKTGTKLDRETESLLVFRGGSVAGRSVNTLALLFAQGKFYQADVYFRPVGEAQKIYDALKKELIAKYGQPLSTGNNSATWNFPETPFHKLSARLEITYPANTQNEVRIRYVNESLEKTATNTNEL